MDVKKEWKDGREQLPLLQIILKKVHNLTSITLSQKLFLGRAAVDGRSWLED